MVGFLSIAKVNALTPTDVFDELAPNDVMAVDIVKPKEISSHLTAWLSSKLKTDIIASVDNCNNDETNCDVTISINDENELNTLTKNINFKWHEKEDAILKIVEDNKHNLEEKEIVITDLAYLSYLNSENKKITDFLDLKDVYNDYNISDFWLEKDNALASVYLFYNGILYDYKEDLNIIKENIIYVSSDTLEEDILKVAKERIDTYFGKDKIDIAIGGSVSELDISNLPKIDKRKMSENYYNVTLTNGDIVKFIIVKDETKYMASERELTDNGVSIITNSSLVKENATLKVNKINSNTTEYNNLKEIFKSDFIAYDINIDNKITNIGNDTFIVKIPLNENFTNRDLVAYYINEDNTLEEHEIVIDKLGNAIFTTNHLSKYIITGRIGVINPEITPQTGDNIVLYVGLFIVSIGAIAFAIKKFWK